MPVLPSWHGLSAAQHAGPPSFVPFPATAPGIPRPSLPLAPSPKGHCICSYLHRKAAGLQMRAGNSCPVCRQAVTACTSTSIAEGQPCLKLQLGKVRGLFSHVAAQSQMLGRDGMLVHACGRVPAAASPFQAVSHPNYAEYLFFRRHACNCRFC